MRAVLLIDFGSTYTKLTAVDVEGETLLGTAAAYTTVQTDINDGLNNALALLEGKIDEAAQLVTDAARAKTSAEQLRIERWAGLIRELAKQMCERNHSRLTLLHEQLRSAAERTIERESSRLRLAVELVEAHNPQQILRRGFAVVRLGGKAMTHTEGVKCGEQIEIELSNGTLQAEVKKITTKQ